MNETIRVRRHIDLSSIDLEMLEELFDREYRHLFGSWNPDAPYGYSPADIHVLAFSGQMLAAHVGFQRRLITVGSREVIVAGTGGVLVDEHFRGTGLGGRVMREAQTLMRGNSGIEFGFLGCRQDVVPFYESTGWVQIDATERCLSRLDQKSIIESHGGPNLICSAQRDSSQWPIGDIDLQGTPW